jgi:hypothetical protein
MIIDTRRAQGRPDPHKPFLWRPLVIKNVTARMVIFMIGPERFIGHLDGDTLGVTGAFEGTRTLSRLRR